jgi:hypothetical protein
VIAEPTLAVAVEPPDSPPGGKAESPSRASTRCGSMPSDSPVTSAMTVASPVPGSAPATEAATVPSARAVSSTVAGQRIAGKTAVAVPMPTSQSPSARPLGERRDQPKRSAPIR